MDSLRISELFSFKPRGLGLRAVLAVSFDGRLCVRNVCILAHQDGSYSVSWPTTIRPLSPYLDEVNEQILQAFRAIEKP